MPLEKWFQNQALGPSTQSTPSQRPAYAPLAGLKNGFKTNDLGPQRRIRLVYVPYTYCTPLSETCYLARRLNSHLQLRSTTTTCHTWFIKKLCVRHNGDFAPMPHTNARIELMCKSRHAANVAKNCFAKLRSLCSAGVEQRPAIRLMTDPSSEPHAKR